MNKKINYTDWGAITSLLKRANRYNNPLDIIYTTRETWKPYKNSFKVDPKHKYVWLALTKYGCSGFGNSRAEAIIMAIKRTQNSLRREIKNDC